MKNKRMIVIAGAVVAFLLALLLTLYPVISNYVNQKYASQIHTSYQEAMEQADNRALEDARQSAIAYNEALVPGTSSESGYTQEALQAASAEYENLLNITGDGIMGYIQIPKINVLLPVFHGTGTETLERGIGHLLGSSLPVGGADTHTILSGHSGMASQAMFTDLEQLNKGDVFYLQVLGEVLAYQVCAINVVLPTDTSLLGITPEKDLCTLITCTPYATNTHRLLVTGERIPYTEAEQIQMEVPTEAEPTSTWMEKYLSGLFKGLLIAASGGIIIISAYQLWKRYGSHRGGGRYAR